MQNLQPLPITLLIIVVQLKLNGIDFNTCSNNKQTLYKIFNWLEIPKLNISTKFCTTNLTFYRGYLIIICKIFNSTHCKIYITSHFPKNYTKTDRLVFKSRSNGKNNVTISLTRNTKQKIHNTNLHFIALLFHHNLQIVLINAMQNKRQSSHTSYAIYMYILPQSLFRKKQWEGRRRQQRTIYTKWQITRTSVFPREQKVFCYIA